MATTKSTNVTNADTVPAIHNPLNLAGARLRVLGKGTVEIAAADSNNHEYRICRLHSSWHVTSILRRNDAITTGTDYDVGLYTIEGGAVVDANLFADAVSLASASVTGTEDLMETGGTDIANIEKAIWELLGLTEDPDLYYDLVYTGITVGSGAGTLSVICLGTDGT